MTAILFAKIRISLSHVEPVSSQVVGQFWKLGNGDRRLDEKIGNGVLQFGINSRSERKSSPPTGGNCGTNIPIWNFPAVAGLGG